MSAAPVAIAGAGPTGIACAIELSRRGVDAVCHDRGGLLESIQHFPEEMRWFSTRDLLDIAGVPFTTPDPHPTRLEALAYYRGVAERFGVRVEAESAIERVTPAPGGGVEVETSGRRGARRFQAPAAVLATGFFHNPRRLDVPGADRPHVFARYVSGYPFHGRDVVVVGGKNGAAEAALDLYRHGARVTLVHRGAALSERVKYWIRPDLENRIAAGSIRAFFSSRVVQIGPDSVRVAGPSGELAVPAEAVFALVGYVPDFALFERCGIRLEGPNRVPAHDSETLESNVPNLYLAGAILGGTETGRIFVENSRHHAALVAAAIERRARPAVTGT
ncbi:MAG TPA: YpdA family putative bacillithiol disulfide reductase [Thermoanaerobaculia bacterium]|nr:YpdA family putative bacillithiol disulfide reductase [Thermoanaerobaculia bacterium]